MTCEVIPFLNIRGKLVKSAFLSAGLLLKQPWNRYAKETKVAVWRGGLNGGKKWRKEEK
jgi:hypothetical protein